MGVKRILVPMDFSKGSLRALAYATRLARPLGAEIVVLFVVEPIHPAVADLYSPVLDRALAEQRETARAELSRIVRSLKSRRIRSRALVASGAPYREIVDRADKLRANLIVMGTHGRTGIARLFLGSVAERVVRTAACPVLTVRGQEEPKARRRR